MDTQNQLPKVNLRTTKVAFIWSRTLYFLSAGVAAVALLDFYKEDLFSALGNLGLTMIFAGLSFRGTEAALMAYVKDNSKRSTILRQLREQEWLARPWVPILVRGGWFFMLLGMFLQFTGA